ncbi:MAG: DNA gyrase subunit A [Anaerolineales bacterium]|nr:DNA gyrase subunit A [Anaerolineales bacterium]
MEVGQVRQINIDNEMQTAYLSYAMSVIVARALPDARDGLKPVQRRILYALHDLGIRADSPYKKSARIVGEVLGKYHPHGDVSVYEAMARLAQDFSMRYLVVDGQGNFGSIDGDAPAAMRYTEARLAPLAMDLLADIEKDTVSFAANFDDTLTEPGVLPAAVPNLLVNGASGIAVGMATSVPPHNLGEVIDALVFMLDRWTKLDDVTVNELMRYVKGPDFPTGGIILRAKQESEGLAAAYGTGRGRILVQARAHVEDMGRGKSRIIVTELPYQTNKSALIERIADLARDGTLEGLADLRDESDRQGMRIVIELKNTADPAQVLRDLYKRTPMQGTFSIINLALVNGEPRLLTLKQALRVFLDHRLEVVRRRSEFDLARARERAHLLEGLLTALQHLDEVIKLIRAARDTDEARAKLIKRFKFSDAQTTAILDMPLRRLAALERKKIEDEYKEKQALIRHLAALLASPKKLRDLIAAELFAIKQKYADKRRTQIVQAGAADTPALTAADLAPQQDVWVTVLPNGLVSRTPGGRQPKLAATEAPVATLAANTRDLLYLITLKGRAATAPVYALPEKEDPTDGAPWSSVSGLDPNARVVAVVAVSPDVARRAAEAKAAAGDGDEAAAAPGSAYLLLGTANGMVKKTAVADLPGVSSQVYTVINVAEDDNVIGARLTTGADDLLLVTALGRAIRFKEEEVRAMGLAAAGVMGIKPGEHADKVIGLETVPPKSEVFLITDAGLGKRTAEKEYPTQGRYGVGVTAAGLAGKQRLVGLAVGGPEDKLTILTSRGGAKAVKLEAAGRRGRAARGSTILKLKPGDAVQRVVAMRPPFELPEAETPPAKAKPGRKAERNGQAPKGQAPQAASRSSRKKPKAAGRKQLGFNLK